MYFFDKSLKTFNENAVKVIYTLFEDFSGYFLTPSFRKKSFNATKSRALQQYPGSEEMI